MRAECGLGLRIWRFGLWMMELRFGISGLGVKIDLRKYACMSYIYSPKS